MPVVPALGPDQRARAWAELAEQQFEVLVVGGGVTGAGVALDAATRGLRTALVEARDFASGTSSRSSKLFHGGLRYLEQLEFSLVREALRERELMLTRLAPQVRFQGWTLPGGGIDHGEDPREAVVREVYEETGLTVEPGHLADVHSTHFTGPRADGLVEDYHGIHLIFRATVSPASRDDIRVRSTSSPRCSRA